MKHSTGKPTKADLARFDKLIKLGCIVTRLYHGKYAEPDIHHLLSGNKRRGHRYTIPLSPWFHRGLPPTGMSQITATMYLGPSLALTPKRFREHFGTDEALLAQVNQFIK